MAADLIKFRRVVTDPFQMPLAIFLHMSATLVQDGRLGKLDPFIVKVLGKMPKNTIGGR